MRVCWFSAGVSSFVACYLERETIDKIIYIHIEEQHKDTLRFIHDAERFLGKEIKILQSRYKSVSNVIDTFEFINSMHGARCTGVLKRRVRKEWEQGKTDLTYIWGYDYSEIHRMERTIESNPKSQHIFPLIERKIYKEQAHDFIKKLGLKRPYMYELGYNNNNCVGCVKGGRGYWNHIRKDFPEVFKKRAEQERRIGHSCIRNLFLDELDPNVGDFSEEALGECGVECIQEKMDALVIEKLKNKPPKRRNYHDEN